MLLLVTQGSFLGPDEALGLITCRCSYHECHHLPPQIFLLSSSPRCPLIRMQALSRLPVPGVHLRGHFRAPYRKALKPGGAHRFPTPANNFTSWATPREWSTHNFHNPCHGVLIFLRVNLVRPLTNHVRSHSPRLFARPVNLADHYFARAL